MKGTIKTLTDRGFGFIAHEGEVKDLFFHSKELKGVTFDELKVGDVVSFEVANGEKGPERRQCVASLSSDPASSAGKHQKTVPL